MGMRHVDRSAAVIVASHVIATALRDARWRKPVVSALGLALEARCIRFSRAPEGPARVTSAQARR